MKTKVYLAGGMRGFNWQQAVMSCMERCPDMEFFDPRSKSTGENTCKEYGTWDLHHIRNCDILFGYMERTNPGGFGIAAEIAYAKALGKITILVLEPNHEIHKDRHLEFMTLFADVVYPELVDGIAYLKSFVKETIKYSPKAGNE